MKIYVDIDETICMYVGERHYDLAVPILENIKKINILFEEGHEILDSEGLSYRNRLV